MELGAIRELVGGVAVLATLLYLARQVRQTTATARLAASSAVSTPCRHFRTPIPVAHQRRDGVKHSVR